MKKKEEMMIYFATPVAFDLTKSQAALLLHGLYQDLIKTERLEDKGVCFFGLITENIRNPMPESSIKSGYKRGNTGAYSTIPCLKQKRGRNHRLFFNEGELTNWFNTSYLPYALAHHKPLAEAA